MTENKFQDALTSTFADILEHAVSHNYLVCVPNSASLGTRSITRRFISNVYAVDHIIKPSPYVENLFQTMTGKNLIIKNDEIKAHTGYTHKFALQIIKEENAHDIKGRVFKQIFVTAPLDDDPNKSVMIKPSPVYKFYSSKEYIGYLHYAVEDSQAAFMFCQAFIQHFNHSYIIFKQFAKEAYNKVKSGLNDLKQLILKIDQFSEVYNDPTLMQYIGEMVESNLLHDIYEKLFNHMIEFHQEQEMQLIESCDKLLVQLPVNRFGFDADLEGISFKDSSEVLNTINFFRTPWEKQEVLCKLAGAIDKECKRHLYKINIAKAEKWETSADQYFPLLIYFIATTKPDNLQASLTFITEFSICPNSSGEKRYHLTNLLAAIHTIYKMANDTATPQTVSITLPPPKPKKKKARRDSIEVISLDESDSEENYVGDSYGVFGPPAKRL
jgi:Vacuolar sorting protein 9 (VPS9) domain